MFKKSDFLAEIDALMTATRPSAKKEMELWSLEYDLYSLGFRDKTMTDGVLMLCETAGELQKPAVSYNDLIKKYYKLKEIKMTKPKIDLNKEICSLEKDWLNICNHELKVEIANGKTVVLPSYKNTPRVVYEYHHIDGKPSFCREAIEVKVSNLPLPMHGVNFVVSRETIRAMSNIGLRLVKKDFGTGETLMDWMQANNISLKGKLRKLSPKNIKRKFPELDEFFQRNVPQEEQANYIKELKRYIARDDIWAPGPRIRDENQNIEACKGLLSFDRVVDTIF